MDFVLLKMTGFVLNMMGFARRRRLGGGTFASLVGHCAELRGLNLGYCCNEEHMQVAMAEERGCARAAAMANDHAVIAADQLGRALPMMQVRVITDDDLALLRTASCSPTLEALCLGGMGSKVAREWPTVGYVSAFGDKGLEALAGSLPSLQRLDLSHSCVGNVTVVKLAVASQVAKLGVVKLEAVNVVGAKCTRELHRLLREAGAARTRVFGI